MQICTSPQTGNHASIPPLSFLQAGCPSCLPTTHLHLSWSSIILYLLPPSTTIHNILPVQFMCLKVFLHNLSPSSLWCTSWSGTSTSYSIHFFTQSVLKYSTIHDSMQLITLAISKQKTCRSFSAQLAVNQLCLYFTINVKNIKNIY